MTGVLFLALIAVGPASASVEVEMNGTQLVVRHDASSFFRTTYILEHFEDAERNGIRVRERGLIRPETDISGRGDPEDCETNDFFNDVVCTVFPTEGVISTSEGRDSISIGGSNAGCVATQGTPFQVNLNDGDDFMETLLTCGGQSAPAGTNRLHPRYLSVSGGPGNDELHGGHLNDSLNGDSGEDSLFGNDGADNLFGGLDGDTLDGGDGNDTLDGQGGADQMIGRGGTDTATYAARSSAVTVTLDSTANDGVAGEDDNVAGVQIVIGGAGGDDLTGGTGGDTLRGEGGNDEIEGRSGADVLTGGLGNDFIDSRETPVVSDTITCGLGFDTVSADLEDRFGTFASCDNVERFAVDDGPPGRILSRSLRVRHNGTARLRLKCPRRARVACRGRLSLTTAVRSRRTPAATRYRVPLAAVRYRVLLGRTQAIRLSLSRGATRRARRAKFLIAATRERGLSKKGPRSSTVRLNARR